MPDDVSFIVTSVTKTLELTIVEYVPISLYLRIILVLLSLKKLSNNFCGISSKL